MNLIYHYLVLSLLAISFISAATLDKEPVIIFELQSQKQVDYIQARLPSLDVWSRESALTIGINEARVTQDQLMILSSYLGAENITTKIDDVTELITQEKEQILAYRANHNISAEPFPTTYLSWGDLIGFLNRTCLEFTALCSVKSIGRSIEGRDIFAYTLRAGTSVRPRLFFSGLQHAREWISPATVSYITYQLLTQYSSSTQIRSILNSFEIHIIPIVNPDGYVYTWTSSSNSYRLWRKNRRRNANGTYGVDLNRNWNIKWGGEGSSHTPSSDTYCGTGPFSEPESKAVSDYFNSLQISSQPIVGAIDFHSYSQLILRPYGYTTTLPPNDAYAKLVGEGYRSSILSTPGGVPYSNEASWELYYTTGTASDYYYEPGKSPLSYTVELRDTGRYGFVLPANQIIPTGLENFNAVVYFALKILSGLAQ